MVVKCSLLWFFFFFEVRQCLTIWCMRVCFVSEYKVTKKWDSGRKLTLTVTSAAARWHVPSAWSSISIHTCVCRVCTFSAARVCAVWPSTAAITAWSACVRSADVTSTDVALIIVSMCLQHWRHGTGIIIIPLSVCHISIIPVCNKFICFLRCVKSFLMP